MICSPSYRALQAKDYPPAYQLAIDMLNRLGQPGFIASAMLARGEVVLPTNATLSQLSLGLLGWGR